MSRPTPPPQGPPHPHGEPPWHASGQPAPPPNWNPAPSGWPSGPQGQPPEKSSNGVVIALSIVAGVLVLGLIGLVATSAGSSPSRDDESSEEVSERLGNLSGDARAVEQLIDELENDDALGLNGLEQRCVATSLVDELGGTRSLEITSDEIEAGLRVSEAEAFADAYVDCIDLGAFFTRSLEADPTETELPDFYVDCLFDELGVDTFRSQFVAEFSGDPTSDAELERLGAEAGDRCLASFTPEQRERLANG